MLRKKNLMQKKGKSRKKWENGKIGRGNKKEEV